MIDYKKLELAHQLCQKLNGVIYADFIMSAYHCEYTISNSKGPIESNPFFITESLDEFIEKLRKFVDVPVAKYKIGQVVHFLYRNTLHNSEILGYEWSLEKHCYYCEIKSPRLWWYESELYPTKAALIKAQIDHWYGLKSEAILDGYQCGSSTYLKFEEPSIHSDDVSMQSTEECEHESDDHHYDTRKLPMQYGPIDKTWQELLDIGCHNKCKKCGEFYR